MPQASSPAKTLVQVLLLFGILYLFLVSIGLMGASFKMFGKGFATQLVETTTNPFVGLFVGILATTLVQSSSTTTSLVVGIVAAGGLTPSTAVPIIMGANIGTSVTHTLVSMGPITRPVEFRRALAGATVHDFFNLMVVAIMFVVEQATGFLERSARAIAESMTVGGGGAYKSPIKAAVSSGEKVFASFFEWCGFEGSGLASVKLVCGILLIFLCLTTITKIMKKVIAHKAERAMNSALKKSAVFAIAIGAVITMAVQSSSITTSLIVPMCGSGILSIDAAFPVMLGANIGTTITAFLASLATGKAGLIIALVHVLFNMIGTIGIMVIPRARQIPIALAEGLAVRAVRNKLWVIAYVFIMFIIIPLLGILIF